MCQYPSYDSDPDEPAYFTSTAPTSDSYSPSRSRRTRTSSTDYSPDPIKSSLPEYQLILKRSDSILEVIAQEWAKEGGWGVWKASNTAFVYGVLLQTLEKWSRGLFSALLNVHDPALGLEASADLVASPYPWASLGVAIAAAVAAGVVLAPLDLIRTKYVELFIILSTS